VAANIKTAARIITVLLAMFLPQGIERQMYERTAIAIS